MSAELPVHESREAVFLKLPHPTLVAHAYDQWRRGDVRLHGVAFVHAHGVVFLALLVACLSLCERLAGHWLRPCVTSARYLLMSPFAHFQGAWSQVTYAPLRCLSLAWLWRGHRGARWCSAALQPHQHANYRPRHRGHKA